MTHASLISLIGRAEYCGYSGFSSNLKWEIYDRVLNHTECSASKIGIHVYNWRVIKQPLSPPSIIREDYCMLGSSDNYDTRVLFNISQKA